MVILNFISPWHDSMTGLKMVILFSLSPPPFFFVQWNSRREKRTSIIWSVRWSYTLTCWHWIYVYVLSNPTVQMTAISSATIRQPHMSVEYVIEVDTRTIAFITNTFVNNAIYDKIDKWLTIILQCVNYITVPPHSNCYWLQCLPCRSPVAVKIKQ